MASGVLQSPCPHVFEYQYDNKNNLIGLIQVFILNDYYDAIRLSVELSVGNSIEGSNGAIKLLNPLSEVIEDIRQNRPLSYTLYFPHWSETPPRVIDISLNGVQICYGNSVDNSFTIPTTIFNLHHSLTIPSTQIWPPKWAINRPLNIATPKSAPEASTRPSLATEKPSRAPWISRNPLNVATPRSVHKTSAIPSETSTRSVKDLSNIFLSSRFFNPNYNLNSITNLPVNNQNVPGGDNNSSRDRSGTFTVINSQNQPNFENNSFSANHKPHFSNPQQYYPKRTTENYTTNFQNLFLFVHVNNHDSSTSNKLQPRYSISQTYQPNVQNNPYFSNHGSVPHFEPHNKVSEIIQSPRSVQTTTNIFPPNPNYNLNYITKLLINNQNVLGGDNDSSIDRSETFTVINSQNQPNFETNSFSANHKPHFSNPRQYYPKPTTKNYTANFENNPFLYGHVNNHDSSTSNKPQSSYSISQTYQHNVQNNPYFLNNGFVPHFEPRNNVPEITESSKNVPTTTTTSKPTRRQTQQTTTITKKSTPALQVKNQVSTTTSRPIEKLPPSDLKAVQKSTPFSSECGISVNPNMLAMNGSPVHKTTHPWLAAIFLQNNDELKFICGSTLVSRKHVITAAHCIRDRRRKFQPEELWIIMGRENIRIWSNDGAQMVRAESTHVHPDYKIKSADADLAIIILAKEAIFSNLIRPACLWIGDRDVNSIVAKSGTVIDWGKDEFGNLVTAEPRAVDLLVVSEEDCLWSNAGFREITSNRTFCAGHRNNSGPCNGDSDGGFYMQVNNKWMLRGIVSMSLLSETGRTCGLEQYVVLTDAAQYTDWLLTFLQ
ncbi:hypothetical protein ILUMI_03668 [Ignelater luminosus]|uniref:Peptidase S1 domain-containing protein n=1 Tax=Ignelater luminosus TaxID=2038154 RepID=A0A8K0GLY4_IGNLU|nr:hypothetical protein ILUMI_03668 [Ignelater luminosus]